jgi:hypothetical protein
VRQLYARAGDWLETTLNILRVTPMNNLNGHSSLKLLGEHYNDIYTFPIDNLNIILILDAMSEGN